MTKEDLNCVQKDPQEDTVNLTETELKALKNMINSYDKVIDYAVSKNKPIRLIWLNLIGGMARGLGMAIGVTVIAFIGFKILNSLKVFDLPILGNFIAELLDYISALRNSTII